MCQPEPIWPPWQQSRALGGHTVGGLSSAHPPRGSAHRHESGHGEDEEVEVWTLQFWVICGIIEQLLLPQLLIVFCYTVNNTSGKCMAKKRQL